MRKRLPQMKIFLPAIFWSSMISAQSLQIHFYDFPVVFVLKRKDPAPEINHHFHKPRIVPAYRSVFGANLIKNYGQLCSDQIIRGRYPDAETKTLMFYKHKIHFLPSIRAIYWNTCKQIFMEEPFNAKRWKKPGNLTWWSTRSDPGLRAAKSLVWK